MGVHYLRYSSYPPTPLYPLSVTLPLNTHRNGTTSCAQRSGPHGQRRVNQLVKLHKVGARFEHDRIFSCMMAAESLAPLRWEILELLMLADEWNFLA